VAALANGRTRSSPYSYRDDPQVPSFPGDRPIFIFDAQCVLCSSWVELILRYDRAGRYRLRLLPSLLPFSFLIHQVSNSLRWGERRGGMFVRFGAGRYGACRYRCSWRQEASRMKWQSTIAFIFTSRSVIASSD
jgi:hypothetical protein